MPHDGAVGLAICRWMNSTAHWTALDQLEISERYRGRGDKGGRLMWIADAAQLNDLLGTF